jgi:hypothetical protein
MQSDRLGPERHVGTTIHITRVGRFPQMVLWGLIPFIVVLAAVWKDHQHGAIVSVLLTGLPVLVIFMFSPIARLLAKSSITQRKEDTRIIVVEPVSSHAQRASKKRRGERVHDAA